MTRVQYYTKKIKEDGDYETILTGLQKEIKILYDKVKKEKNKFGIDCLCQEIRSLESDYEKIEEAAF